MTLTQFLTALGGPPVGDATEITCSPAMLAAVERQAKTDRRKLVALAFSCRELLTRLRQMGDDHTPEWRAADRLVRDVLTPEGR